MATEAENHDAIVANILQLIATQTALWVAAGCPPVFSVDGLSVNWVEWLKGMQDAYKQALENRAIGQPPFVQISRHRS